MLDEAIIKGIQTTLNVFKNSYIYSLYDVSKETKTSTFSSETQRKYVSKEAKNI